jgi:hypothetical protein
METHIDVLEALMAPEFDDEDNLLPFFQEVARSSDDHRSFDQQILTYLKKRRGATAPLVTDEDLKQFDFVVTGRIANRCTTCRRGYKWTEQQFRCDRSLQRILLGEPVTCPFCSIGHLKVYGVKAVHRQKQQLGERKA